MATCIGTFFFNNLLDTGITAQSQAGKKNPKNTPRNRIIGWIQEIQESLGKPTEKFDLKDPFLLFQLIYSFKIT